jgi:truncated hemoglobin YjbI
MERRRKSDLAPDPEMWAALDQGALLSRILDDFYTRAFADPRLAPFFEGRTKDWIAQKQFSFLQQLFTGIDCYFGDRPRNAHHWMVISDELFDYREELMEGCLRRAGLPAHLVARWRAVEERFRKQIVKDAPIPRKIRGVALPLEGYESIELTIGTLCDGCAQAVESGQVVRYHVRTGKTYCATCMPPGAAPVSDFAAPR